MSADQPLRVSDEGPVRIVTIDRPERRNAVDDETAALLLDGFNEYERDDDARARV